MSKKPYLPTTEVLPMKYRRMEFNAQLQTENDRLRTQRDVLLEALRRHVELHDGDCICEECAAIKMAEKD